MGGSSGTPLVTGEQRSRSFASRNGNRKVKILVRSPQDGGVKNVVYSVVIGYIKVL
jgi:hypothetical protein